MVGVKGQDQGWAIGQIHLIDYNFASNCHRDFKLGSYFSLWKAATNMTLPLTLKSSTKVKTFETYQIRKTSQTMLGNYEQGIIYCWQGQGQGRENSQIHLISYNFASNCHRDFKLGLFFSLWKAASNMTFILTLKSSPKVKIFETYQLRKTSQNIPGYYAQGIIYSWQGQKSRPRSSKTSNSLNWL